MEDQYESTATIHRSVAGTLRRLSTLPESGRRLSQAQAQAEGWKNNWADWDNDGHNDWQNGNSTPPPGGK